MCVYAHTLYITAHLLAFPFPEANAAQQSLFLSLDAGHALEAAFWFRKWMSTTIIIWVAHHLASGNRSSVATRGVLLFCRLFAPRGHWLPPSHAAAILLGFSSREQQRMLSVFYPWVRRRGGPVHILWYLNWRARNERCCLLFVNQIPRVCSSAVGCGRVLYYYLVYCSACSERSFVTCLFCFHFSRSAAFKFVKCLSDCHALSHRRWIKIFDINKRLVNLATTCRGNLFCVENFTANPVSHLMVILRGNKSKFIKANWRVWKYRRKSPSVSDFLLNTTYLAH